MSLINTFTAIDFETAQGKHHSICQVGLVRVEENVITERMSLLIQPPDNFYSPYNIRVHGITPCRTIGEPTFNRVWHKIEPYIINQNVVAHNTAFDMSCLRQTLAHYSLSVPFFKSHCTYKIYGEKLNLLCKKYGIDLDHHDALSDAIACAKLFMKYNNERKN